MDLRWTPYVPDPAANPPLCQTGVTHWDREETARQRENPQLAGRSRRWWQVLGSNQRRLSRRFFSPILLAKASTTDQRVRHPRRRGGPSMSTMCPCARGRGPGDTRTGTDGVRRQLRLHAPVRQRPAGRTSRRSFFTRQARWAPQAENRRKRSMEKKPRPTRLRACPGRRTPPADRRGRSRRRGSRRPQRRSSGTSRS